MKPHPVRDELLQELHVRLKELYGDRLDRLILFGSHARGDNHEESDIDVMVVLKGPIESVYKEIGRIVDATYPFDLERGEYVSVVPVALDEYLNATSPLLLNVRREGIVLEEVGS